MTAINYTAKRRIVPQGLSVVGSDVSILASDDSFNSPLLDLLGLVTGDWIEVAGSAVDDGWHQLSIDSTTNKITVTSALTDEAAGSDISIVGYYHGYNESYDLETASHVIDLTNDAKINKSESLSGVRETILLNDIDYWNIVTDHLTETELAYWREFVGSVRAGETFTIDLYGTIAVADEIITVELDGNPKISRITGTKTYQMSFKVKVI